MCLKTDPVYSIAAHAQELHSRKAQHRVRDGQDCSGVIYNLGTGREGKVDQPMGPRREAKVAAINEVVSSSSAAGHRGAPARTLARAAGGSGGNWQKIRASQRWPARSLAVPTARPPLQACVAVPCRGGGRWRRDISVVEAAHGNAVILTGHGIVWLRFEA